MKQKLFLLSTVIFLLQSAFTGKPEENSINKHAAYLHDKILTVDTHTDTPLWFSSDEYDFSANNKHLYGSKIDILRLHEGGMDAIFLAVYVGQGVRNMQAHQRAKQKADNIFAAVFEVVEQNKDQVEIALSPADAYTLNKAGKKAIFIGLENGYPLGNDLNLVKNYYDKGARYITLSHIRNNDICDASTDTPEHNGLTGFGKKVVKQMNKLGMIVDVSHISDKSFYDVLDVSKAPIIASHSCARAICDNPRNLSDDMLLKLAENGGVIQVCLVSDYVKTPVPMPERDSIERKLRDEYANYDELGEAEKTKLREKRTAFNKKYPKELASVSDLVDHIDHIVEIIGIGHVGIGTDFDGGGGLDDCKDVSEIQNITIELIKRGYSDEDIEKIWGANFMRVFEEVRKIAKLN